MAIFNRLGMRKIYVVWLYHLNITIYALSISRNDHTLNLSCTLNVTNNYCRYYNGEKTAPILTLFVGGNHEASNYLQELPYGGWVAPKIYYLGYAGVVNIQGIRIGGISGIYKGRDYLKGHFEIAPYNESTKRSVYHIRNLEILRLKQLSQKMDIFLSHDWPNGIWKYGNVNDLLKFKPHFRYIWTVLNANHIITLS